MKWFELLREAEDEGAGAGGDGTPPPAAPEGSLLTKPAEAAAPEPLTTESLTIPEGVELHEESLTSFLEIMNNGDLSPQERANALIELQQRTNEAAGEALAKVWNDTQEEWRNATTEALGDNLDKSLAGIRQLVDDYGTPEVLEAFDLTGAGNHPAIVGFLAKVAEALVTEGGAVSGAPTSTPQDRAHRMYPNMN